MVRFRSSTGSKVEWVDLTLLALLGYHYYLRVDAILHPAFAFAGFLLGALCAGLLARSRLRLWAAMATGTATVLLLGSLVSGLFSLFVGPQTAPGVDALAIGFRSQWELTLPLVLGIFYLNIVSRRIPRRGVMTIARGAILVLLFWSEAFFDLSLYHHPMTQAIVVGAFVVLEVLFLALLAARRDRALLGAPVFAALLPIIVLVVLFLLGRYNDASLAGSGGLIRPTLFQFDFSDYLTLESEISLSRDLVLLYRRDGDVGYDLLRRYVLSGYDQRRGFFLDPESPDGGVPDAVPRRPRRIPVEDTLFREPVSQEYFLVNFESSSLLALNNPERVIPLEPWEGASFSAIYQVESLVPRASITQLGAINAPTMNDPSTARTKGADWIDYYTEYGESPSISQLAVEAAGQGSDFTRVRNIEIYLKENFFYSLKPGIAPDGDQLEHFLFESRKGYCSYFAFAMTEMVRSIGIPARVAVGFFVEPRLQVLNFYSIRADMAHAWVEVYFDEVGWVEFDPTSSTLHPEEDFEFDFSMDEDRLSALLQEILEHQDELQIQEEQAAVREETAPGRSLLDGLVPFVLRNWWGLLLFAYLLALLLYHYGPLAALLLDATPAKQGRAYYRLAVRRLSSLGLPPESRELPLEYARRLADRQDISFEALTRWYLDRLFRPAEAPRDVGGYMEGREQLKRSLRNRFSLGRRLLGYLLPFLRLPPAKPERPSGGAGESPGATVSGRVEGHSD
jgi:transglutaminase-like putative cysteine protease